MSARANLSVRPAELPLPGGRSDATLTLRPLLCAELRGPIGWFHRADGPTAALKALGIGVSADQQVPVPIVAFLLEHPVAGLVLVDTGFHRSIAEGGRERSRNLGAIGRVLARDARMRPEQAVVAQLQALGIDPADVGVVVMTHLHFDHASALCDFPAASVLVAAPELDAARARGSGMNGYSVAQLAERPSYRTIDFSAPVAQPHGPFAQAVDLFADGSLMLVSTPGHSAGHLSLVVRLREREALIAGDAVYTLATLREGERPWRSADGEAFERSLAEIAAYDRDHPDALIIPGHDAQAWEQLEQLYR